MRPLVRAAIAAAMLVAVSRLAEHALPARGASSPPESSASAAPRVAAPCPAGSLPDRGTCIPVPSERGATENVSRALSTGEHVPRRPDRPEQHGRYRWPIPLASGARAVAPGDAFGVILAAAPGAPVRLVRLEHQEGDAEIAFAGELAGKSVMTRHSVREGAALREVLVLVGRLGRVAPAVVAGARLASETTLGFAGSGDPGLGADLYFAVRRVRDGVQSRDVPPAELVDDAHSVAIDPRNALSLAD